MAIHQHREQIDERFECAAQQRAASELTPQSTQLQSSSPPIPAQPQGSLQAPNAEVAPTSTQPAQPQKQSTPPLTNPSVVSLLDNVAQKPNAVVAAHKHLLLKYYRAVVQSFPPLYSLIVSSPARRNRYHTT